MHMEMQNQDMPRQPNPRRRKRSKFQIFKESYLPVIIVALTVVCLIVFIIGSLSRGRTQQNATTGSTQSTASTAPTTESTGDPYEVEVENLLASAAVLAEDYDYAGALEILESFSGDMEAYPKLKSQHAAYTSLLSSMVEWKPDQVVNLSFHLLIADAQRAFNDNKYGYSGQKSYLNNFITTTEFQAILDQLYENGAMLVSLSDLYTQVFDESSGQWIYQENTLLLPPGRIPVILTETNANYYSYMVDSNDDGKPDANGDGFAYNLCYGENGFYNEMVMADGTVVTGAFDMVPLLEDFIARNPDFSYRDARAIIAMSGYDGILGHHFNSTKLTEAEREEAKQAATAVIQALREHGYEIACFTYNNYNYSDKDATQIQSDLQKWTNIIAPVVGEVDILVYPKEADIAGEESYVGNSKFNVMYVAGFSMFLGTDDAPWSQVSDRYVRHNRILVTGEYLAKNPQWYTLLFDAAAVQDPYRENFR